MAWRNFMGFETTVVIAIFLVSLLIIGTNAHTSLSISDELLEDSYDDKHNRQYDKLQTGIEINSVDIEEHGNLKNFTIDVLNSGSTSLSSSGTTFLIDGLLYDHSYTPETDLWTPQEVKTFILTNVAASNESRVKVITDNGIFDYAQLTNNVYRNSYSYLNSNSTIIEIEENSNGAQKIYMGGRYWILLPKSAK